MNNYFMETHHHEWILTNKLGSYALGTGNLINQRKYHGLLIASDRNFNRHHLVAGMEEKVEWRGQILHLDSNNYSNCIYPEGFLYLVKPWLRPFPTFLYSALPHQNDILIRKEIKMDADTNAVLVKYTNLGQHKLHFTL
ncbi:MAG: glycogen debranching enzyme N-terminal domain-containing protein, partial [Candidatus Cloacimonetes bacterium]|nr:glycogen debranching enzyme N-terminal domain-containing protein [Candidatus Cloacimonadota bacterium]